MPRGKQNQKADRKERNRAFQAGLRQRKRERRTNRMRHAHDFRIEPENGTFTMTHGGHTTAPIPHNATLKEINEIAQEIGVDIPDAATDDISAGRDKPPITPPYKAPDVKDNDGWQIVDSLGQVVEHARSRDKARTRARELNGTR